MDVIKRLQNHNINPSVQRIAIMNYLMEHCTHQTLTIDERNTCYDADTTPHAHFLCKHCGKIYDLECNANIKQVEDMDMGGHEVQEIHYYYKGICKSCLENEQLTKITNN